VEIGWGDLEHNRVTRIFRNPRYAGAFFHGRTRFQKKVEGGGRAQRLPRQEWHTLILDAHPGYITWQDYEENLRRLQENAQIQGVEKRSAVREGPSLLQGLAICGKCGGRMTVGYRQSKPGLRPTMSARVHAKSTGLTKATISESPDTASTWRLDRSWWRRLHLLHLKSLSVFTRNYNRDGKKLIAYGGFRWIGLATNPNLPVAGSFA
jgi:hypothetical protein